MLLYIFDNQKTPSKTEDAIAGTTNLGGAPLGMPGSFLPVFLYYHKRLTEWSLYFRTCKVCGKIFFAKSLKYTICSDKCRKKQNTQAKRDFDARALENEYDHIYKNEAQRWLHYIHRMKKSEKKALPVWFGRAFTFFTLGFINPFVVILIVI